MVYFEKEDILHLAISEEPKSNSLELSPNITKESTGANAALIISQTSGTYISQTLEGHFYLELIELPSLNILAIGRSENQPKE